MTFKIDLRCLQCLRSGFSIRYLPEPHKTIHVGCKNCKHSASLIVSHTAVKSYLNTAGLEIKVAHFP